MSSILAPAPTSDLRPTAARRFGYSLAVAMNGVGLWLVHQLLDWGWPGFLTEDFREVLPLLSTSLLAGLLANVVFHVRDRGAVRDFADLVTNVLGIVVSVRLWQVFPFAFDGYTHDWSWAVRVMLALGIVGAGVGALVALVRLITGAPRPD